MKRIFTLIMLCAATIVEMAAQVSFVKPAKMNEGLSVPSRRRLADGKTQLSRKRLASVRPATRLVGGRTTLPRCTDIREITNRAFVISRLVSIEN